MSSGRLNLVVCGCIWLHVVASELHVVVGRRSGGGGGEVRRGTLRVRNHGSCVGWGWRIENASRDRRTLGRDTAEEVAEFFCMDFCSEVIAE